MTRPPRLLLTRPAEASAQLLEDLTAALGTRPEAVISPLIEIVPVSPAQPLPRSDFRERELILTSQHGAERAAELGFSGTAWCVGSRTAERARAHGFDARSADGSAVELIALINSAATGPLLHLRGQQVACDMAGALRQTGHDVVDLVVYDQRLLDLTPEARALLDGERTVVIPLYSPATARQFDLQPKGKAPQRTIAISAATAQSLSGKGRMIHTVSSPTGAAMQEAILQALTETEEGERAPLLLQGRHRAEKRSKGGSVAKSDTPKDDKDQIKGNAQDGSVSESEAVIEEAEVIAEYPAESDIADGPIANAIEDSAAELTDETPAEIPVGDADPEIESEAAPAEASEPEPAPETAPEPPAAPAADPVVIRKGPGAGMLLLGGLVAGGVGYGASYLSNPPTDLSPLQNSLGALERRVEELSGAVTAMPDLTPVQDQLSAEGGRIDQIGTQLADLGTRLDEIESWPTTTEDGPELSLYERQLQALRTEMEAQSQELAALTEAAEARLADIEGQTSTAAQVSATLQAEAEAARAAAEAATKEAKGREVLAALESAIAKGEPFEDALPQLAELTEVPTALADLAAKGVPTQSALTSALPDAARSALRAARDAGVSGDEQGSAVTAFFKKQLNVRATTPQEGDTPEAILSRVEAAVAADQLDTALTEIEALPDVSKSALADWTDQARARFGATEALTALSTQLFAK